MATMTQTQREEFLAEAHVGVLGVVEPGRARGPLTVPIWYAYSPGSYVSIVTSPTSRKGLALTAAARFSLVAQREAVPYLYVSVEGPVVSAEPCDRERDLRPLAVRYLGDELGNAYADGWHAVDPQATVYRMRPERWLTYDSTAEFSA
jgi:hypothetical protein